MRDDSDIGLEESYGPVYEQKKTRIAQIIISDVKLASMISDLVHLSFMNQFS